MDTNDKLLEKIVSLFPQHYNLIFFIRTWATISCSGFCHVRNFTYKSQLATGQLKSGQEYDFDFDHQFIETEKYDAKPTYKKFLGYSPGVAVINDMIVGIENRDGNTNVRFNQRETLERIFKRLEASLPQVALWGKGILCLRHFCCVRNMYNKMNFVVLQAKSH